MTFLSANQGDIIIRVQHGLGDAFLGSACPRPLASSASTTHSRRYRGTGDETSETSETSEEFNFLQNTRYDDILALVLYESESAT